MQTRDANQQAAKNAVIFRQFEIRAKAEGDSADSRSFDVIASSEAIDSYGSRVVANWRLGRYEANPIVLFGHNSRDAECIIGTASNVRVESNALVATITLLDAETSPTAERCFRLLKAKALKGVSVGFMPHSYRWAKESDVDVLELDDNELFEISLVSVPANPEALAQLCARARQERDAPEPAPAPPVIDPAPTPASPAASDNEPLLAAVRKLTGKDGEEAAGALLALSERAAKCDALEAEVLELKRAALLNDAVVSGKITRDFANGAEVSTMSDAELRGYLSAKQVRGVHIKPAPQPTRSVASGELTEDEIRIAKQMGNDLDAVRAAKVAWEKNRPARTEHFDTESTDDSAE